MTCAQTISSAVYVTTVYSQNERFYLTSVPFDNRMPSVRGRTAVFQTGIDKPVYQFERGFDSETDDTLILSNDGQTIFYTINWGTDEQTEGLNSVSIYKNGKLFKSYTESQITGCEITKERCSLLYSNYEEVVDKAASNWGSRLYKKVYKEGVSEKEKFLSDYVLFSHDDIVYLTDSKKMTHLFDLKNGEHLRAVPFDTIYGEINNKGRSVKTRSVRYEAPTFLDFPKLSDGKDVYQSLARHLGMKAVSSAAADEQYKLYRFKITSTIDRNGSLEIEDIELFDELPKEKILAFFKSQKFDRSSIPVVFDKWYLGDDYFYFRKADNRLARKERRQEILKQRAQLREQLSLANIDGVYIPSNLQECFIELDKSLNEIDKKEMKALPKREDMIQYHHGLGMSMRNRWRLWAGSRLTIYFQSKGVTHPEEMSSVVLYGYYDWLNGDKDAWKDWEKNPKAKYN